MIGQPVGVRGAGPVTEQVASRPRGAGPMPVAVVITRLEGGAGVLALRGAQAVDPTRFTPTIVTGSRSGLIDEAARCGLEVVIEPSLRAPIDPRNDLIALRRLERL